MSSFDTDYFEVYVKIPFSENHDELLQNIEDLYAHDKEFFDIGPFKDTTGWSLLDSMTRGEWNEILTNPDKKFVEGYTFEEWRTLLSESETKIRDCGEPGGKACVIILKDTVEDWYKDEKTKYSFSNLQPIEEPYHLTNCTNIKDPSPKSEHTFKSLSDAKNFIRQQGKHKACRSPQLKKATHKVEIETEIEPIKGEPRMTAIFIGHNKKPRL